MAVNVDCSICGKFIKKVEPIDFQKLTGQEICDKCGKKVNAVYGELDKMVLDFGKVVTERQQKMVKLTGAFQDGVKKYTEMIQDLYIRNKAHLDRRMEDILGGKK